MLRPIDRPVRSSIVVMGVSGSGKSTVGAMLAAALDCPFLEGDAYHSAAAVAKMRSGEPLTDADRWPWLDRLGSAIGTAARANGAAVAACSALRRCYRDRLRATIAGPTCFILLTADREALVRRLVERPGHYMPASLLDSQLATLEPPAAAELALTLDASETAQQLSAHALEWLRR